jgi:hypothetical protein
MSVIVTAAAMPTVRIVIVRYTSFSHRVWKLSNENPRTISDVRTSRLQNAFASRNRSDPR